MNINYHGEMQLRKICNSSHEMLETKEEDELNSPQNRSKTPIQMAIERIAS